MKTRTCPVTTAVIALLLATADGPAAAQTPGAGVPQPAGSVRLGAPEDQEPALVELLDASLGSLADWSLRSRRVGGYVLLGLGSATAVGGVATLAFSDSEDADIIGGALIGGGILLGGLSLLPFKIRSEAERVYEDFAEMPAASPDQLRAKFAFGDRRFEELARKRERERYVNGAILLGIGITDLIFFDQAQEWTGYGFGTTLVGGLAALLLKTEEERRFESYQRAKADLVGAPSPAPTVGFGLGVLPRRGVAWTVQLHF